MRTSSVFLRIKTLKKIIFCLKAADSPLQLDSIHFLGCQWNFKLLNHLRTCAGKHAVSATCATQSKMFNGRMARSTQYYNIVHTVIFSTHDHDEHTYTQCGVIIFWFFSFLFSSLLSFPSTRKLCWCIITRMELYWKCRRVNAHAQRLFIRLPFNPSPPSWCAWCS